MIEDLKTKDEALSNIINKLNERITMETTSTPNEPLLGETTGTNED